jgi:hypothetical protein
MEVELHKVTRADVAIINPTLNDIIALSRLPQGSLTAIWLEARTSKDRSVCAHFVGHEGHYKAPYVLLRAKSGDVYYLDLLQRAINDRFEVSTTDEVHYGHDDSSVIVHFKREKGSEKLSSDKRLYQRAMRLLTDPATFGFDAAEPTRLVLKDLPVSFFAPLNRLGDAPHRIEFTSPRPWITIERKGENSALSSAT